MKFDFRTCGKALLATAAIMFATASMAEDEGMDPTWVKQGVDWSKYSAVRLKPLDVDDVRIMRPPWAEDDPKDWSFESDDPQLIQSIYRDAMRSAIEAEDGYSVVHHAGEDVLEIRTEILTIMPYVRPGKEESDGYELLTMGSGELKARVEFRDASSRDLLMLIEGDRVEVVHFVGGG